MRSRFSASHNFGAVVSSGARTPTKLSGFFGFGFDLFLVFTTAAVLGGSGSFSGVLDDAAASTSIKLRVSDVGLAFVQALLCRERAFMPVFCARCGTQSPPAAESGPSKQIPLRR